ncbi:hypothetical protein PpBr36_02563 [Pyricularia pennisetigena]|uniref:hypothetical protein n=1 Tax=Pyricularia pennisetigena TaxID=1578925 RepID=UPI0011503A75|nr:hypothetical protein PpBr36_02563 [Pyricularia pennisetigena]TLS31326.1 hypothetical protein PpBr36_02563 [Pyricularia pennisetigena]
MYMWYQASQICYAFLRDVPDVSIEESNWFTRGWTLQELIAPKVVAFYNKNWKFLGTKSDLRGDIFQATGIEWDHLKSESPDSEDIWLNTRAQPTVATKMSWIARRETSKPEDKAYCMLGIFEINMPLLYGEGGRRAFLRLQEEIVRVSNDQTIFCWRREREGHLVPEGWTSLLAPAPELYADMPKYIRRNTSIRVQGKACQNPKTGLAQPDPPTHGLLAEARNGPRAGGLDPNWVARGFSCWGD